jgi:hypothetical protein
MWLTLAANNYQGRMATTTAIPNQHSSCLHLRSTGNICFTHVWKVMPLMVELSYDVLELEWATRLTPSIVDLQSNPYNALCNP